MKQIHRIFAAAIAAMLMQGSLAGSALAQAAEQVATAARAQRRLAHSAVIALPQPALVRRPRGTQLAHDAGPAGREEDLGLLAA